MSPYVFLALVPVLLLMVMFVHGLARPKGALVRVRADGRRVR